MKLAVKGELIQFITPDSMILHGFLSRPENRTSKVILHLHGLEGSFYQSNVIKTVANKAVKNGFNFLTIEQRGSYNISGIKKKIGNKRVWVTVGGDLEKFEDCVFDISGAINYLQSIGMYRVYIEGHSTGCQKGTYYIGRTRDRRVKGLILIAPDDDYNIRKQELKGKFHSAVAFAKSRVRKHPEMLMSGRYKDISLSVRRFLSITNQKNVESRIFNYNLKTMGEFAKVNVPIFAIFGSKEQYAVKPVKTMLDSLQRNSKAPIFNRAVVPGADHGFEGKEDKLAALVINWLKSV